MVSIHGGHDSGRLVDIGPFGLARTPAGGRGRGHKAVSRPGQRRLAIQAQSHAQNIGRVRLEDNGLALAVEFQALAWGLDCDRGGGQDHAGKNGEDG